MVANFGGVICAFGGIDVKTDEDGGAFGGANLSDVKTDDEEDGGNLL